MAQKVGWTESDMQIHLFQWIDRVAVSHRWMTTIFHPANGGQRHISTAERLKREGVRAGVPDVIIPQAIIDEDRQLQYVGMALELKLTGNRLSQAQALMINQLVSQKWLVIIVYDFFEVAAWHISQRYKVPYGLPDYCAVNADKHSSIINQWSEVDYDRATKGGYPKWPRTR